MNGVTGKLRLLFGAWILLAGMQPVNLLACAACYGQSNSPMAQGMNWGIMSLLGIIGLVLGGVAGFFVYLARRSVALSAGADAGAALPADPEAGEIAMKS